MIPKPLENLDVTAIDPARDAAGNRLPVTVVGTGPALALAHGASGGVDANFGHVITALENSHTLVGPDFGVPGSIDLLADRVVAAAVQAGHERFPILGLSMGTMVAVNAAVRYPERVSGLLLTVGLATADAQARTFAKAVSTAFRAGDYAAMARTIFLALLNDAQTGADEQQVLPMLEASMPLGGAEQLDLVASASTAELLAQVAVPTVVFLGAHDRVVLPSTTRALAAGIDKSELIEYPGAGHVFTPEQQPRWIADIQSFLDRL